ncbi:hypothetical protein DEU56DRAFT_814451 [Suillus clintonianus]|uniref:uncharacterized protein n=1 Tax=Suillus clintonianus TaxID=1904413 RepID=UPI001B864283|nr:uncharacterized protein DEU56DRAFT_814451 [Suillus clintonianus]KAG2131017.1 hypothetical protein DEU56DRAFT_814451 [Suillus clintonianus]
MSPNSTDPMWGPGLIGFIIATTFYGIAFGQYIFYVRWFPQDSRKLKLFIMMVFCFETIHQYAIVGMYWSILISCRRSTSLECAAQLPWQMLLVVLLGYWIAFAVQCFYAYRVWIITAQNRLITGIVCALATLAFVCGMSYGNPSCPMSNVLIVVVFVSSLERHTILHEKA